MASADSIVDLLSNDSVRTCPVDRQIIMNLMNRAGRDIDTSRKNLDTDEDCSFTYGYNAMLHASLGLMASEGYRALSKNKHATVVRFVSCILGKEFAELIVTYDYARRKRHRLIYEPALPCSRKEAEDLIGHAEKFVLLISEMISAKDSQLRFDFRNLDSSG